MRCNLRDRRAVQKAKEEHRNLRILLALTIRLGSLLKWKRVGKKAINNMNRFVLNSKTFLFQIHSKENYSKNMYQPLNQILKKVRNPVLTCDQSLPIKQRKRQQ